MTQTLAMLLPRDLLKHALSDAKKYDWEQSRQPGAWWKLLMVREHSRGSGFLRR
jgi:hypothetical protein